MNIKKMVTTAALLALCIVSIFLKSAGNLMIIFVTGAIVNTCIILSGWFCGLGYGAVLCVLAPIASYFLAPSPITQVVPAVVPCIMAGNMILLVAVCVCKAPSRKNFFAYVGLLLGAVFKALFMGLAIGYILLPNYLPDKMLKKLDLFRYNFSFLQLYAALVGCAYALILFLPLKKVIQNEQ